MCPLTRFPFTNKRSTVHINMCHSNGYKSSFLFLFLQLALAELACDLKPCCFQFAFFLVLFYWFIKKKKNSPVTFHTSLGTMRTVMKTLLFLFALEQCEALVEEYGTEREKVLIWFQQYIKLHLIFLSESGKHVWIRVLCDAFPVSVICPLWCFSTVILFDEVSY